MTRDEIMKMCQDNRDAMWGFLHFQLVQDQLAHGRSYDEAHRQADARCLDLLLADVLE